VKLETTQIYTQVSIRQLKPIHTATHPGAKLEARRARATAEDDATPGTDELLSALAAEASEEENG
jgi:integrase/recombinase XerD